MSLLMWISRRMFLGALGASSVAWPAEPGQAMFNGQDLTGWSVQDGPESAFYVNDGAIVGSPTAAYPAWLRSDKQYENFDLQCEVFFKGWSDGGLYLHAPEHGRPSYCGLKVNIFHAKDNVPKTNSMGAIFREIAPKRADVHKPGEWNRIRVLSDWPVLRVWINEEMVQDVNFDGNPELARRLRRGYIGLTTLTYPLQFRGFRLRELPSKTSWTTLFSGPEDLAKWSVTEANQRMPARFAAFGRVLHGDGLGNLTTKNQYKDFELQMYIRGSAQHNGGVLFRSKGGDKRYEIQLHDVAEAHYPTGSLYHHKRARYLQIPPERWFLFQLGVKGKTCWVRVDGETVLEYDDLQDLETGTIELQAHQAGRWIEYKEILVRAIQEMNA